MRDRLGRKHCVNCKHVIETSGSSTKNAGQSAAPTPAGVGGVAVAAPAAPTHAQALPHPEGTSAVLLSSPMQSVSMPRGRDVIEAEPLHAAIANITQVHILVARLF